MMKTLQPITAALLMACGSNADSEPMAAAASNGEVVYKARCAMCHGRKGDLGLSDAKDLTTSKLSYDEALAIITTGKGGMMGFGTQLSRAELEAVAKHVLTLRAPPAE